jgi:hypothetical protein
VHIHQPLITDIFMSRFKLWSYAVKASFFMPSEKRQPDENAFWRLGRRGLLRSYFNIQMANGVFHAANVWFSLAIVCESACYTDRWLAKFSIKIKSNAFFCALKRRPTHTLRPFVHFARVPLSK